MMRCIMVLWLLTLLSSCATRNADNYTQIVQSWRGSKLHNLVRQWGTPEVKMPGPSGTTIYTYKTTHYIPISPSTTPTVGIHVGQGGKPLFVTPMNTHNTWTRGPLSLDCYTTFSVDRHGTIVNTHIDGQGCHASTKAPLRQ